MSGDLNEGRLLCQVAGALVGCALPLSELEAQLLELHADVPAATPTAVRSMVLDLAARRSFAAKGGAYHGHNTGQGTSIRHGHAQTFA